LSDFGLQDTTSFEHVVTEEPFYLAVSYLTLWNHAGLHCDAPSHIIKGATPTDRFPLEKFLGPARVLDFRFKPKNEPLLRADFEDKRIESDSIVIAFVGYTPPTDPDDLPSYAYLSGDAAEYLAGIPIKAFATDMPGVCGFRRVYELLEEGITGSENVLPEHYAFLSRDIPVIEGVVNLESLVSEENIVFVGFPLKIRDGNAGPIRAAALVY
jgi:kynurenine formamidase